MRSEAKSAILSEFFDLKIIFIAIRSKFFQQQTEAEENTDNVNLSKSDETSTASQTACKGSKKREKGRYDINLKQLVDDNTDVNTAMLNRSKYI